MPACWGLSLLLVVMSSGLLGRHPLGTGVQPPKGITMPTLRLFAPLGVAAALVGLVAVAPAGSSSGADTEPTAYRGPTATASGGSAGLLVYPSIVNVRLVRAEAALARATTWVDQAKGSNAIAELKAAQSNMQKAWTAAKYVIDTTPPPVATDGAFAHSSGGAPAGPSYASPEDTAFAVLSLQHDVVTTSLGLLDAGNATLKNTTLPATIKAAVDARDAAIAYIHSIAPPPVAGDGRVHADASGGAVVAGWDTTMPSLLPVLDDEIQAIKGTRKLNPTFPDSIRTFLPTMRARDEATKAAINRYWPPLPADD